MDTFFITLYEMVIGSYKYGRYFKEFFFNLGSFTLLISFLLSLLFYVVLNRLSTTKFATITWWLTFLLINTLIAGLLSYLYAKAYFVMDSNAVNYNTYAWKVIFANAFYSIVFFILFSIPCKAFSTHASKVPF